MRNVAAFGAKFICDGKQYFIERYKIQVGTEVLKNIKNSTIRLVFYGLFFDESVWGLTDIKILTGCLGFTKFD